MAISQKEEYTRHNGPYEEPSKKEKVENATKKKRKKSLNAILKTEFPDHDGGSRIPYTTGMYLLYVYNKIVNNISHILLLLFFFLFFFFWSLTFFFFFFFFLSTASPQKPYQKYMKYYLWSAHYHTLRCGEQVSTYLLFIIN